MHLLHAPIRALSKMLDDLVDQGHGEWVSWGEFIDNYLYSGKEWKVGRYYIVIARKTKPPKG